MKSFTLLHLFYYGSLIFYKGESSWPITMTRGGYGNCIRKQDTSCPYISNGKRGKVVSGL